MKKEECNAPLTLGIIGAMEMEIEGLKAQLTDAKVTTIARMDFWEGRLMGRPTVVVRSGVGKVNAAVCTQILADRFRVDAIINTGVAGSLCNDLDIGDLVISSDVMHHDVDATLFGYAKGEVPQLGITAFPADERLAKAAEKACMRSGFPGKTMRGRVVSGDQFIVSKAVKERIIRETQGVCTEMEGAAIAQTAWLNEIPFLILRAISDKADESASMEYPVFEAQAARLSLEMLLALRMIA